MPPARHLPGVRVFDLVGLAVTLAFAAPVALFGAQLLVGGDPLGLVYVALGAAVVGLHHVLTTPDDLPGRAAQRLVGLVVKRPGDRRDD